MCHEQDAQNSYPAVMPAIKAAGLLDLIHTDVAGPQLVMSKGGAGYFVTKSKSDGFSYFGLFFNRVET